MPLCPSFSAGPSAGNTKSRSAAPCRHKSSYDHISAQLGDSSDPATGKTAALAASVTPHDTVIITSNGHRLPGIPLLEAKRLNMARLRQEQLHRDRDIGPGEADTATYIPLLTRGRPQPSPVNIPKAPAYTHPLFPPLPLYGPATPLRQAQCYIYRLLAGILSTCFLLVIMAGALINSIPLAFKSWYLKFCKGENPDKDRPFYRIEAERALQRQQDEEDWENEIEMKGKRNRTGMKKRKKSYTGRTEIIDEEKLGQVQDPRHNSAQNQNGPQNSTYCHKISGGPTEGGRDRLICDVGYYARRVGLDVEEYKVETEDGFLITLQRVFDPKDPPLDMNDGEDGYGNPLKRNTWGRRKYPVLLIHGLLQSSGAFCVNDDDSLAFFLCKSGYDVWLGNNRCGSTPEHTLLKYSDPRMWAWNIRQMGILDLPAFIEHILSRTGFPKLALVAHSQGTAQTFVALAREQRPELGEKISVFCALAPAVYAGKLVEEIYFKFMESVSPSMFRIIFGIHAFIPFMMFFHSILPGKLYGMFGYQVFSYLFKWSDKRWDRALRDRFFMFSPVYVSAESMRWWLGRECFATQKCILATRAEEQWEEDRHLREERRRQSNSRHKHRRSQGADTGTTLRPPEAQADLTSDSEAEGAETPRSGGPWYNTLFPPLALWICGSDDLVDGKRFLRRLQRGREPHVRLVHSRVIEEYEHLDVLWAIDSVQKVGCEVRDVIWRIATEEMEKSSGRQHWADIVEPVKSDPGETGRNISVGSMEVEITREVTGRDMRV